jgi:hypothetical protein
MATRKKKGKQSFQPVDFEREVGVELVTVLTPPEPPKKTFDEVITSIKREIELVKAGVSLNCAFAIQVIPEKNPFCRALTQTHDPIQGKQAQELIRLAFQEFGNKFSGFVKEELRNLF